MKKLTRQTYAGRLTRAMNKKIRKMGQQQSPKKVTPRRVYK